MRVLTSFKTTNLDLHGEAVAHKIAHGKLAAHHLASLQKDHDHHQRSRDALMKELKQHGITAVEVRRGMYWPDMGDIDAVIAVGGDGTLLEASHHIKNSKVPLIGIRSSPMSVGFLCYCSFDGISEMVEELAEGHLPAVLTPRLQGGIRRVESGFESLTVPILNDLLYTNSNPAATSRYKITFNGKEETQRSSGIWIATPAGSTGAISAAGGKQVSIRSQEMQFCVRELHKIGDIRGMTQLQQGFFDPDTTPLVIENHSMEGMLALDGHQGKIDLSFGDTVTVCRAEPLRLVTELG
jgi:NAD+ kinase